MMFWVLQSLNGISYGMLLFLLASGLSSSVVGTMAGQVIMQDFLHWQSPLWLRRTVTMIPAFVVVGLGVDTTQALVLSQVVLSLALPVPMLALVWLTGRPDVMGAFANRRWVQAGAVAAAALVLLLNAILVAQTLGVELPLLG
jgi:manganese transport protein